MKFFRNLSRKLLVPNTTATGFQMNITYIVTNNTNE